VSITPDALAADWAWRTNVKVILRCPAARAGAHPAASTTTTMMATKRRIVTAISADRADVGVIRRFTREV
jgi:hypothetical protein